MSEAPFVKSNMFWIVPAVESVDPEMRVPPSQLSSTNLVIEDWSVRVWST